MFYYPFTKRIKTPIHPFSTAYPRSGCGGSSLKKRNVFSKNKKKLENGAVPKVLYKKIDCNRIAIFLIWYEFWRSHIYTHIYRIFRTIRCTQKPKIYTHTSPHGGQSERQIQVFYRGKTLIKENLTSLHRQIYFHRITLQKTKQNITKQKTPCCENGPRFKILTTSNNYYSG